MKTSTPSLAATCLASIGVHFLALSAAPATASDATTLQLDWTEVVDRVSPNPQSGIVTRKRSSVSLAGTNQISEQRSSTSGRFSSGAAISDRLGGGWRVGNENSLIKSEDYPHHTRTMTVRVSGNSCRLEVAHTLKPGFTDYVYPMLSRPGQQGTYSRIATLSTACSIR